MSTRSFIILAVLATGCASSSSENPADAVEPAQAEESDLTGGKNDLAAAQQKIVLGELNNICGDTWCEGDYSWDFKKITCDFAKAKTCTLTVLVTDPGLDGQKDLTYWRACKMKGLGSFEAMIDTAPNGYQSLADAFYDKADACVTKLQAGIPSR